MTRHHHRRAHRDQQHAAPRPVTSPCTCCGPSACQTAAGAWPKPTSKPRIHHAIDPASGAPGAAFFIIMSRLGPPMPVAKPVAASTTIEPTAPSQPVATSAMHTAAAVMHQATTRSTVWQSAPPQSRPVNMPAAPHSIYAVSVAVAALCSRRAPPARESTESLAPPTGDGRAHKRTKSTTTDAG